MRGGSQSCLRLSRTLYLQEENHESPNESPQDANITDKIGDDPMPVEAEVHEIADRDSKQSDDGWRREPMVPADRRSQQTKWKDVKDIHIPGADGSDDLIHDKHESDTKSQVLGDCCRPRTQARERENCPNAQERHEAFCKKRPFIHERDGNMRPVMKQLHDSDERRVHVFRGQHIGTECDSLNVRIYIRNSLPLRFF